MVRLIDSSNYTSAVVAAINRAKNRVYVLALIVQQSKDAAAIIRALNAASNRGIDVNILSDFSTYSYVNGHLSHHGLYAKRSRSITDMINRLKSSGGTFKWLGMYPPFLFAGRTHAKWIIADDECFAFGGINLQPDFSKESDFMLYMKDKSTAHHLIRLHKELSQVEELEASLPNDSREMTFGKVLFDGGQMGNSLIYRSACSLASRASHTVLATQYCPTGKLARILSQGSTYKLFYNEPDSDDYLTNKLIAFGQRITNLHNFYKRNAYIHAKYMICTMPDGSKIAITGSHNFISYGGWLGTREIALETSNPDIIRKLELYHEKNIA